MNSPTDTVAAMPHALGVEKSVLSVLLQYPETIDDAPNLTAEHFYMPGHRIVFDLICKLSTAGQPVELVTFIQRLLDDGQLDRVGGPAAIAGIYAYAPSPTQLQHHIDGLTAKMVCRMMIAAAAEMTRVAYEAVDSQEIIEATSAPITKIHDTITGTRPAISTKEILRGCFDRYQKLCAGETSPMGIETSLTEINHRFRGLHPKQTIVLSAYPGGGKTTLAGQLAIDAALGGHNSLFCSLEMPQEALMDRLLAYVARRPGDAITDPLRHAREKHGASGPTNDILQDIKSAAMKIAAAPFHIEDLTGANAHQIAACIRRAHRKTPLKVVVVDYAQRIRPAPEKIRESREQQLAHASNHLADLSKELGFTLLLPSQLNKEGAAKHAEAINEDADLHLQIVQDRSGPAPSYEHRGIAVVKDRHHGNDGKLLSIILDGPMVRFVPKPFST